ncbi:hypothetical protein ACYFX5_16805 [Bremerella sp. T1]|uniref:hypothetical protein n=1 Tax=Bremerella sp. TYQ1 TaxID=3119568 RepID=UPI001CCE20EB|nr:hypothetical protein [Bremerella volcania]UBM34719.1 hypothetical protein LA756_18755 [Bremerella volcania]
MTMTREHWLGYLMGALDENEHASVERQIAEDPRAAEELDQLRTHLNLMSDGLDEAAPPAGLASRTCAMLDSPNLFAEILDPTPPEDAAAPQPKSPHAFDSIGGGNPNFTLMDMMVALGACVAAVAIFFPALASSRMLATRLQCENNLRQVGMALQEFATGNAEKRYPAIATTGPLSVAGAYAPRLINDGFIRHPEVVRCAEKNKILGEDAHLPTVEELLTVPEPQVAKLQDGLGNVYSYNLGNLHNGTLKAPLMRGRSLYPVAADIVRVNDGEIAPQGHEDGRFNILFDDGHVEFISLEDLPKSMKQYFLNDEGHVAAGVNEDDAVVAHGTAHPVMNLPAADGDQAE